MEPLQLLQPDADDGQCSMDDHVEGSNHDENPARSEQFCPLNELPLEVLREIFSYLPSSDRKNIRLVCSLFYDECGRNEHVHIRKAKQWKKFRNCRLNNMNVTIDCVQGEWDPDVWKEVGARIRSLHMNTCMSGHGSVDIVKIGLENVIMFCENLQTLRISLRNDNAERFCSPSTLRAMNIVRNKLETLIIQKMASRAHSGRRPDDWMELFIALLRIFPNVRHYASGSIHHDFINKLCFTCSCSMKPEFTDQSELSSGLALMLSGGQADWSRALGILSKLSFSVVTFIISRQAHHLLRMALSEFFEKQKALVSGKMKQGSAVNFTASREHEFERSVIQQIASHWASIRDVHVDKEGVLCVDDMFCLSRIEFSDPNSELLHEALLDIRSEIFKPWTSFTWKHEPGAHDIYSREFLKRYESIKHLILTLDVSDKMLQTIFQFLTRLVSLNVRLGQHNTCHGLTGTSDCSSAKGYSIKRLQQLDSLSITSDGFSFEDSIFDEFDFPKLRYLTSLNPKELATLRNLILRLPALQCVSFYTQEVASFLNVICPARQDPITVHFLDVRDSFDLNDWRNFFHRHSSLHILRINYKEYLRGSI